MNNKTLRGALCVLATALLFGSMEVTISLLNGSMAPMQICLHRFLVGGLLLLAFATAIMRKKGIRFSDIPAGDWKRIAGFGFVGIVVSMSLFQVAVSLELPAIVAVIMSATPIFTTILAVPIAKEQVRFKNIVSVALGLVAMAVILAPNISQGNPAGVIVALLAAVTFALYGLLAKPAILKYGGVTSTCLCFLAGALELLAIICLGYLPPVAELYSAVGLEVLANVPMFDGYTLENLPVIIYVYAGVTCGGYVCWFKAIDYIGAQGASLIFFLKPIIACTLAAIIVNEPITLNLQIGVALLLMASVAGLLPSRTAKKKG